MEAVSELKEEFPFVLDYNSGNELGMGKYFLQVV